MLRCLPAALLLLSLNFDGQVSANDVTQRLLHKGWVRGNRHSILSGTIGKLRLSDDRNAIMANSDPFRAIRQLHIAV